jgi:hypothetical protein
MASVGVDEVREGKGDEEEGWMRRTRRRMARAESWLGESMRAREGT